MKLSTILYTLALVSFFGILILFITNDHKYSTVMVDLFVGLLAGGWIGGTFYAFGKCAEEDEASMSRIENRR